MNQQTQPKATPGPWYFEGGVVMPDGETYEDDDVTVYRGNGWQRGIAQLVKNPADGRIIAAAPDMAEALRSIAALLDVAPATGATPSRVSCEMALHVARAALAKVAS